VNSAEDQFTAPPHGAIFKGSMPSASPFMLQPKYVALDTSTWIDLFKRQADPIVKDILDVLNSGQIVVYASFEHVLELVAHSDQSVRLEQLDFFRLVKLIGSPKPISFPAPWRNSPPCGSYGDVQACKSLRSRLCSKTRA